MIIREFKIATPDNSKELQRIITLRRMYKRVMRELIDTKKLIHQEGVTLEQLRQEVKPIGNPRNRKLRSESNSTAFD